MDDVEVSYLTLAVNAASRAWLGRYGAPVDDMGMAVSELKGLLAYHINFYVQAGGIPPCYVNMEHVGVLWVEDIERWELRCNVTVVPL